MLKWSETENGTLSIDAPSSRGGRWSIRMKLGANRALTGTAELCGPDGAVVQEAGLTPAGVLWLQEIAASRESSGDSVGVSTV